MPCSYPGSVKIAMRFFFLVTLLFAFNLISQTPYLDSLNKMFGKANDTTKVRLLIDIVNEIQDNNALDAFKIADSALTLSKRISYQKGIGISYSCMGNCYTTAGKYDEALVYLHKALKIFESIKDKRDITNALNTIGNIYIGLNNKEQAYQYYYKAYKLANEEPKNEYLIAIVSVGLGNCLLDKNEFKEAISFYEKAENYFKNAGIKSNEAVCMLMVGETYYKDSNFVEAEKKYLKALQIFKEQNNQYGLASNYKLLGDIAKTKGNLNLAAKYYRVSLDINFKRKAWEDIKNSALNLSEVLELLNKPSEALYNYKIFQQYNDSIINIEKNKAIAEAETKYESEKKEQQLQLKNIELEKSQLEISQRNYLIYGFASGIVVFLVLLFAVYRQYNQKKKANILLTETNSKIEQQNFIIEEKNKNITDSINYSKHIQQSILPSISKIQKLLPNSFVFFKPKDIVSGDFYLIEEVNDLIYVAVVDCTGHGVPGAMLSVFAFSAIKNSIIDNKHKYNPAAILSELCVQFKNNLQSHSNTASINDGVDMGIVIIDKKNSKVYFAGAKNNLIVIRNNKIIDFFANRWGISGSNSQEHLIYTNHTIDIQKGDKFYLSTDGYQDQFGGPKGKKFKLKQLKELVLKQSDLSFDEQARKLELEFNSWKGYLEQIDDVTIVGFEV